MNILTEEQIGKINEELNTRPWMDDGQGIITEGAGVPSHIKEQCIYRSYNSGGTSGGSCWDTSNPRSYTIDEVPEWKSLKMALDIVAPGYTEDDLKMVESIAQEDTITDRQYYGNYDDYQIDYIPLSRFYAVVKRLYPDEIH